MAGSVLPGCSLGGTRKLPQKKQRERGSDSLSMLCPDAEADLFPQAQAPGRARGGLRQHPLDPHSSHLLALQLRNKVTPLCLPSSPQGLGRPSESSPTEAPTRHRKDLGALATPRQKLAPRGGWRPPPGTRRPPLLVPLLPDYLICSLVFIEHLLPECQTQGPHTSPCQSELRGG